MEIYFYNELQRILLKISCILKDTNLNLMYLSFTKRFRIFPSKSLILKQLRLIDILSVPFKGRVHQF